MRPTTQKNISVSDSLSAFINTREIVRSKLQSLQLKSLDEIVLDFSGVEFVSRSAMHEILATFRDSGVKVATINETPEVRNMMTAVSNSMRNPVKRTSDPIVWQKPIDNINAALDMLM